MKNLFVPYELALLAKEKGFNEPCFTNFNHNKMFCIELVKDVEHSDCSNSKLHRSCVSALLYQQLVDWFRETHKMHIEIKCPDGVWKYLYYLKPFGITGQNGGIGYNTYYESLNAALIEAFKLI